MPSDGDVSGVSRAAPAPEGLSPDEGVRGDAERRPGPAVAGSSAVRGWSFVLAAALLAGLGGFGIGEAAPGLTPLDLSLVPEIRASMTKRTFELRRRATVVRDRRAALSYGGLGMLLGLGLGVAGGLVRRSWAAAVGAGLAGLVLGGAAGAGASLVVLPAYDAALAGRPDADVENNLAVALLAHAGIWAAVGAAAGLALGLGLGGGRRIARAFFGGILAALLAAAIYEFAGAIIFPVAETFRPVAVEPAPRLLAHVSVALWVAIGAFGMADYLKIGRPKPAADALS